MGASNNYYLKKFLTNKLKNKNKEKEFLANKKQNNMVIYFLMNVRKDLKFYAINFKRIKL
jgi:hypothetical protein